MKDDALPSPVQSTLLSERAGKVVKHGYFTREGGVSDGIYRGLNVGLGSSDDRARVEENRARVSAWFGAEPHRLATLHQVHSPDAVIVDGSYDGTRAEADALVTATPGLVIGRSVSRLRPRALCRCRGWRHRRRPCRLEGRTRRRARKHDRGDDLARRAPRPHQRQSRPLDQPPELRGWHGIRRAVSRRAIQPMPSSSPHPPARATPCSICRD